MNDAEAFLAEMYADRETRWQLAQGVELLFRHGETGRELQLIVPPAAQPDGLLRAMLARRYDADADCDGCHLCLNGRQALVLWWPLRRPPQDYPEALARLWRLAGPTIGN